MRQFGMGHVISLISHLLMWVPLTVVLKIIDDRQKNVNIFFTNFFIVYLYGKIISVTYHTNHIVSILNLIFNTIEIIIFHLLHSFVQDEFNELRHFLINFILLHCYAPSLRNIQLVFRIILVIYEWYCV